jgi:hypothetical protein
MKFVKPIVIQGVAICLFLLSACRKQQADGYADLHVYTDPNGISNTMVYLRYGTGLPDTLSAYTYQQTADVTGQAYFENLRPGNYFILATGFDEATHKIVKGQATVELRERFRQNVVAVSIALN